MFVFVLISNTDIEKVGLFTSRPGRQSGNLPCAHLSIIKKMEEERKNEKNKKYTTTTGTRIITGITVIFIAPFNLVWSKIITKNKNA